MADADGWIGEAPRMQEEDLRQWCADRNRWAERIGLDWWYRVVIRKQGLLDIPEVEKVDGCRALEARARAKGRHVEHFRTEGPEAAEIHAKVARIIRENPGMTQDQFNRLVDEGRV